MDSPTELLKPSAWIGVLLLGESTRLYSRIAAYVIGTTLNQLFFNDLAKIPGPWLNRISYVPYIKHLLTGTVVDNTEALHKKYGPVVRISPTDVSFTSVETAWPQIYGFRTKELKGHATHEKSQVWFGPSLFDGATNVFRAGGEEHSRLRKLLSHAFSEKALNKQEPLLQTYVNKLIDQLHAVPGKTGETINIVEWYNWTTFDIIADLLFGEPFGNLDDLKTHEFIDNLFKALQMFGIQYMQWCWPVTKWMAKVVVSKRLIQGKMKFRGWVEQQINQRLARDTDRPDFMSLILKNKGEENQNLTDSEIKSNAVALLTAGSETTATFLSGVTWLLLKNPDVLKKLQDEIRGHFDLYEEILLAEVAKLPYLHAVINEGLRYYPPVPTGFPRQVAEGGEVVSGYFIPKDTAVYVSSFTAHHDEANFLEPQRFDPDRWLGAEKYKNDKQDAIQPFSFGPHNCLGKNLAYGEMRLILAKLIWSFDIDLDPSSDNWLADCKVFTLWRKAALNVRVKARKL